MPTILGRLLTLAEALMRNASTAFLILGWLCMAIAAWEITRRGR